MVLIDPDVLVRIQKDIDDESAFKKVLFSLPHWPRNYVNSSMN
jgi:hypothetical protein